MTDRPYADPAHAWNGASYHTGKPCIEKCGRPAGTAWSPYWCQQCNTERMDRIGKFLRSEVAATLTKENHGQ